MATNSYSNVELGSLPGGGSGDTIWQQTAGTISPVTAGDDLDLGAGNLLQNGGNHIVHVLPGAGGTGIDAAYATLQALGGGTIQLFAGTYNITTQLGSVSVGSFNNIEMCGVGDATILSTVSDDPNFITLDLSGEGILVQQDISNVTLGDTQITFTTVAQGGTVLAGDWVMVKGNDGDSVSDLEIHRAAANGSGITGIVTLQDKIVRTMTTCKASVWRDGFNNNVHNLKMVYVLSDASAAIKTNRTVSCMLETLTIEDYGLTALEDEPAFINGEVALDWTVRNCRFLNLDGPAVFDTLSVGTRVENNMMRKCAQEDTNSGFIQLRAVYDCSVKGNVGYNSLGHGVNMPAGISGEVSRRITIKNNHFEALTKSGITGLVRDFVIADNHIINAATVASSGGIFGAGFQRGSIRGNTVKNCKVGIRLAPPVDQYVTIADNLIEHITTDEGILIIGDDFAYCNIDGNIVRDIASGGVFIHNAERVTVSNNVIDVISAGSTGGIALTGDAANIIITGNSVSNCAGAAPGLFLADTTLNVQVLGNNFNGEAMTIGSGTGHVVANNI